MLPSQPSLPRRKLRTGCVVLSHVDGNGFCGASEFDSSQSSQKKRQSQTQSFIHKQPSAHLRSRDTMSAPFLSLDQNISDVQPLHQDKKPQLSNLEHQRQLLARKLAEKETKIASPTDSMMSPCTAKLQANKQRHYNK